MWIEDTGIRENMNKIRNIVKYFHDCYKFDNKESVIWDIFDNECFSNKIFTNEDELLINGMMGHVPVNSKKGIEIEKYMHIHRKEKELVYCPFSVLGTIPDNEINTRKICSPLLFYPVTIKSDTGLVYFSLNIAGWTLNKKLIDSIIDDQETPDVFFEALNSLLNSGESKIVGTGPLIDLLQKYVPKLNCESIINFPLNSREDDLRYEYKLLPENEVTSILKICSCGVFGIMDKSEGSQGVLDELKVISETGNISEPLRLLLNQPVYEKKDGKIKLGLVPSVLNGPQIKALRSASTNPMTLIIGPPGTGKSYTIATIAIEHINRGESVLIASKMNHAVDVVGDIIENHLGIKDCVVRGGRKGYLKDLKIFLEKLLSGMIVKDDYEIESSSDIKSIKKSINELDSLIKRIRGKFEKVNRNEIYYSKIMTRTERNLIENLMMSVLKNKVKSSFLNQTGLIESLNKTYDERNRLIIELIHCSNTLYLLESINGNNRKNLNLFLKALRSRTGGKKEDLFKDVDFRLIFKALPVWLVELSGIHEVLPLKAEMFDIVIIDESTQCDISSCIPVLQRAKKAVIVGDPKQLRHISFLPGKIQDLLSVKYLDESEKDAYDYRKKSILDLANEVIKSQHNVVFLDEHFRSETKIIQFSNKEFYNDSLKIMKNRPDDKSVKCIFIENCDGIRNQSGYNEEESRKMIEEVKNIIGQETEIKKELSHSIGILSPFRDQVDHIEKHIMKEIDCMSIEKHDILIGTAYSFQGEERDIMLISLTVDNDTNQNTVRFLEKPDIFNVMITRAKIKQIVYCSVKSESLSSGSILKKYLEYIEDENDSVYTNDYDSKDAFVNDVVKAMEGLGVKSWVSYPVAGFRMDMVVSYKGKILGIDLIGYPGEFENAFSLNQYKMVYRVGLKIIPLSYSSWNFNRVRCIEKIMDSFK
jgi:superfamily I DNA and/or RNA helicase